VVLLAFVAAVGAAVIGTGESSPQDTRIETPFTVTDCEGPVRVILSRDEAIAFLEQRGDPVPKSLRRNEPPVEQVVIELREGPPGEPTPFAPVDPLRTDC
jgi:hypothetical protein